MAPTTRHVIDYGWIPYEIKHPGQQCIAQGERRSRAAR